MAEEEKKTPPNQRTYEVIKNERIERFTTLINTHGIDNVAFFEVKDSFVYSEAIRPFTRIAEMFPIIHQLQGRVIEDECIKEFKEEYFAIVEKINSLEKKGLQMIAKTDFRNINDRTLRQRVQRERRKNAKSKDNVEEKKEEKAS